MTNCRKNNCVNEFGCSSDVCPDFTIKRHDTKPFFELNVADCDGPLDLTDTVVEVSMWAKAKLKAEILASDTYFALADNIGFQQIAVGDIIVVEQIRSPEQMLVTGFDEANKLIQVQRGYGSTTAITYKKGTKLKIFRVLNSVGTTEMTLRDILKTDGTTDTDVIVASKLIYEWAAQDTCLPGCFYLEVKLLKMVSSGSGFGIVSAFALSPSFIPSFTTPDPTDMGCTLPDSVEWVRRFPVDSEGYLVQIVNSPTSEMLI